MSAVGEACIEWSHLLQRPTGLYISINDLVSMSAGTPLERVKQRQSKYASNRNSCGINLLACNSMACGMQGNVKRVVSDWPEEQAKIAVITDGERILGLGDLGVNGLGISVGEPGAPQPFNLAFYPVSVYDYVRLQVMYPCPPLRLYLHGLAWQGRPSSTLWQGASTRASCCPSCWTLAATAQMSGTTNSTWACNRCASRILPLSCDLLQPFCTATQGAI